MGIAGRVCGGDPAGKCCDHAGTTAPVEHRLWGEAEQARGKGGSQPVQRRELGPCSTCVTDIALSHGHHAGNEVDLGHITSFSCTTGHRVKPSKSRRLAKLCASQNGYHTNRSYRSIDLDLGR